MSENISISPLCPMCRLGEESVEHILCHCNFAKQCSQQILPQVLFTDDSTVYQWWEQVLELACDNEKRAEVATIRWSLWKSRNDLI